MARKKAIEVIEIIEPVKVETSSNFSVYDASGYFVRSYEGVNAKKSAEQYASKIGGTIK